MLFVEGLRLLLVVVGALVGIEVGGHSHSNPGRLVGGGVGVGIGYVIGGIGGRLLDRGMRTADRRLRRVPAIELISGVVVGGVGVGIGTLLSVPLFAFVNSSADYPLAAALAWVLGALGLRLGMTKGHQIADAVGLIRRLTPDDEAPPPDGLLLDTSALMDRSLLALSRAGLLGAVVIPEVVLDEARTLAGGPDPVASRRARRALEMVEELRALGTDVTVVAGDALPATTTGDKVVLLAERLSLRVATCSPAVAAAGEARGIRVIEIGRLAADLAPDHVPGEHLHVALVRPGRQPRQAIGYLPDGDMVVVNDAEHLVGEDDVEVVVLSTRATSQGILVFAQLPDADKVPSLRRT